MVETLSHWFTSHRWMALTALVLVLAGLVLSSEIMPRWQALWVQYTRWQEAEHRIADVETWDTEKVRIGHHKRMLRVRYEALYVSLPQSDQMSVILSELQQVADSVGVRLTHIRPARASA